MRTLAAEGAAVFVATFAATAGLAAANGGYFPSEWAWASLAFAWLAGTAALFRVPSPFGRAPLTVLGCLGGLTAWTFISLAWAPSGAPLFGAERSFVYLTGVGAALIAVRRHTVPHLLGGVAAGLFVVDAYALATRLFPGRVGTHDALAANRLTTPVGYWNALGLASVIAAVLVLGFVVRGRTIAARALAAASLPVFLLALYFTFSRGSWLVLFAAACVLVALDARRVQLFTASLPALVPAAIAVWLGWRSPTLGRQGSTVAAEAHDGHRLAAYALILMLAAALGVGCFVLAESRVTISKRATHSYGAVLCACLLVALVGGLVHVGGPLGAADRAWHSFAAPPVQVSTGQQESKRLFSLSSNGRIALWRAAWREAEAHRLLGGGAGSYEAWWNEHRPIPQHVRDAHSLYLQTLAELGPMGLALLVVALGLPLAAAVRNRRRPLVPFAVAAYVAYLIHTGADWDWQLTGVTLPALLVGVALVAADRPSTDVAGRERTRVAITAVAGAAAVASLLMLLGNLPLRKAESAAAAGRWRDSAVEARKAARWIPWSSEPARTIGEAELATRQPAAARRDLRVALGKDHQSWQIWFDLSAAEHGRAAARDLERASKLNPLSPEISQLRSAGG